MTHFPVPSAQFESARQAQGIFGETATEKRGADFEPVEHRGAIGLGKNILGQISCQKQIEQLADRCRARNLRGTAVDRRKGGGERRSNPASRSGATGTIHKDDCHAIGAPKPCDPWPSRKCGSYIPRHLAMPRRLARAPGRRRPARGAWQGRSAEPRNSGSPRRACRRHRGPSATFISRRAARQTRKAGNSEGSSSGSLAARWHRTPRRDATRRARRSRGTARGGAPPRSRGACRGGRPTGGRCAGSIALAADPSIGESQDRAELELLDPAPA